jgi:hypothetical protein
LPVILATWEAEIRRMEVQASPGLRGDLIPKTTSANQRAGRKAKSGRTLA